MLKTSARGRTLFETKLSQPDCWLNDIKYSILVVFDKRSRSGHPLSSSFVYESESLGPDLSGIHIGMTSSAWTDQSGPILRSLHSDIRNLLLILKYLEDPARFGIEAGQVAQERRKY
jgi:hypothetical protein